MTRTELIAAVREHAHAHYEQGWDVVVESYEDDEIAEVIGKARTAKGAIARMAKAIEPYNERRQEIEATADKDESIYVPHTYLSLEEALEVVEGEEEAHSIANAVTAGTRSAERHADLFPSWEMITTESGAYFSTDNDVVRRHIADQRRVLGMYLSGEWSLGTDLGLSLGMCRDQAFVIRLMELELHRREQEAEKSHVNEQAANDNPVPETFVQDVVEAEAQAHLIAEKVAAGIQQAKDHASTLPAWEPITTPQGASLSPSVDELHNQIANSQGNLSRYLSGEWSVGLDLELGVGMIRDEAFVLRLMELEVLRRLDQDEITTPKATQDSRYPIMTQTGVVCGNCTHYDGTGDRVVMRHATANDVRNCYAAKYDEEQAILAEIEAEKRAERHFEEGF